MAKQSLYPYPLPTANGEPVLKMQQLLKEQQGRDLSYAESKELLESLMRLVYLTQLHKVLHPLHEEIAGVEDR